MQDGWDSGDKREKQGKQGNARGKPIAALAAKIFFSLWKKNIHQLPVFPAVAEIPFGIQIFQINPTAQGALCTKLFRGERRARGNAYLPGSAKRQKKTIHHKSPFLQTGYQKA